MKETQQQKGPSGQGTQISQYLKGANYPADRDELQRTAKRNGAPNDIVDRLNRLPNQRFNTENDVTNAFSQGSQGGQGSQGAQGGQGSGQSSKGGQGGGQSSKGDQGGGQTQRAGSQQDTRR